jgi:hypothetical protein
VLVTGWAACWLCAAVVVLGIWVWVWVWAEGAATGWVGAAGLTGAMAGWLSALGG